MRMIRMLGTTTVSLAFALSLGGLVPAEEEEWHALNEQFNALYAEGRITEAAAVAEQALRVAEKTFGSDDLRVADALLRLVVVYGDLGRPSDDVLERAGALYHKAGQTPPWDPTRQTRAQAAETVKAVGSADKAIRVTEAETRAIEEKTAITNVRTIMTALLIHGATDGYDQVARLERYPEDLGALGLDFLTLEENRMTGTAYGYRYTYRPGKERTTFVVQAESLQHVGDHRVIEANEKGEMFGNGVPLSSKERSPQPPSEFSDEVHARELKRVLDQ